LDLSIPLSKERVCFYEDCLKLFLSEHNYVECPPKIKHDVLEINSTDFIAFLGYLDPTPLDELELRRFKKNARKSIEQLLVKSLSSTNQAHYKWCLTAMKSFPLGRFR
jgi:hypothetical protein